MGVTNAHVWVWHMCISGCGTCAREGGVHVCVYTVCVQIFVGPYFRKFRESMGVRENENAKICTHAVQVCSCRPTIRKIKISKLVRCGVFTKYTSCKNLCTYGS